MEESASNNKYQNNIPDKAFSEFQLMITSEKIFEFSDKSKEYTDKIKYMENPHRLNKSNFISICKDIFSSSTNPFFNQIYVLIFERFKEKKCVFKNNRSSKLNMYILSDVVSTEKIEIYTIQIFFCALMQTEFKKKIETIFYITDSDNDGLINEREIKKLILTTNKLFFEESSQYISGSNLIQQSLSNLKAKNSISTLLYGAGGLRRKLEESKYITFEQFYDSLTKIDNYMYKIIPIFISLKNCLLTQRKEIEFKMNKNCENDFLKISYELINQNNNIISPIKFLKKCFDQKRIKKKNKVNSFREIRTKKEKERDSKKKKLIQTKRNESIKNFPSDYSFNTNETNKTNKKSEENNITIIENNNNNNINSYSDKKLIKLFKINNQNFKNDEYKSKTHFSNFYPLKKLNSLNYQHETINKSLMDQEQINPENEIKKIMNYTKLKTVVKIPKKSVLRSSSYIPNYDLFLNKSNSFVSKMVTFSDNLDLKKSLSQQNYNQDTLNYNLNTNYSTFGKMNSLVPNQIIKNYNKISIINFDKTKTNNNKYKKIKSSFRKSKIVNNINNSFKNSFLSRKKTIRSNEDINDNKIIEKGDYYKFTSIVFPPCLINIKDSKENFNKSYIKKGFLTQREKNNNFSVSRNNDEIDGNDYLLKLYGDIKGEILSELEHQKNNDIYGLKTILKIEKNIEEKKQGLPLIDLSRNQIQPNLFFNFIKNKKKK